MENAKKTKYEERYGIGPGWLRDLYVEQGQGLRTIERKFGIPYAPLKYLAKCYGIFRPSSEAIRLQNSKMGEVFMEKYGVDNPSKLEEVKKKIQANRSVDAWRESCRKTNMERYGVPNVFQTAKVKAIIKEASDHPEAKEKLRARQLEINADKVFVARRLEKARATLLERYGG